MRVVRPVESIPASKQLEIALPPLASSLIRRPEVSASQARFNSLRSFSKVCSSPTNTSENNSEYCAKNSFSSVSISARKFPTECLVRNVAVGFELNWIMSKTIANPSNLVKLGN